jgi:hypothetical protein
LAPQLACLLLRRLNSGDVGALTPDAASGVVWALGTLSKGLEEAECGMQPELQAEVGAHVHAHM